MGSKSASVGLCSNSQTSGQQQQVKLGCTSICEVLKWNISHEEPERLVHLHKLPRSLHFLLHLHPSVLYNICVFVPVFPDLPPFLCLHLSLPALVLHPAFVFSSFCRLSLLSLPPPVCSLTWQSFCLFLHDLLVSLCVSATRLGPFIRMRCYDNTDV